MERISECLKTIVCNYSNSTKEEKLFKAIIEDLLPGDEYVLFRNLLRFCVSERITSDIANNGELTSISKHQYVKRLVNHYGCDEKLASETIETWASAILEDYHPECTEIVISLSETDRFRQELEELKQQLVQLVAERDELVNVICPELERQYLLNFGSLEVEVFSAQCDCLRLKRQLEMMRARRNRQEPVNLKEILKNLKEEFSKYQESIDHEKERVEKAVNTKTPEQNQEETGRIKKLYRNLVKKLHPDINPHPTVESKALFNKIVEAYKDNDLQQMEMLNEIAAAAEEIPEDHTLEQLQEEIDRILEIIKSVQSEIEFIKDRYPYNKKDLLDVPEAVEQEKKRLEAILKEYEQTIRTYQEKIKVMEEADERADEKQ